MNKCLKCAHRNVCEWCIDDNEYDYPTCSDFLEERAHGKWTTEKGSLVITCSVCNKGYYYHPKNDFYYNFCPNCGAYMRGNEHD